MAASTIASFPCFVRPFAPSDIGAFVRIASFARVCALGAVGVLALAASAGAHGAHNANIRPLLDPLPAALAGMRIEVHSTIGSQLVMENSTNRVVEVLDPAGVAFLRISARGAEGNLNARAWYATYSPGAPVPTVTLGNEPRWVRVRSAPTFGWFEPRVDSAAIDVPHAIIDGGRAADVGRWTVPLRVDGAPVSLTGRFRFEPPVTGAYIARMTSSPQIARGVHVRLLPGAVPGLLVENMSEHPLVVFGIDGEPFLRIGPRGVDANTRSETWRRSARTSAAATKATGHTHAVADWQHVAQAPRYSWIEPRATWSREALPIRPTNTPDDRNVARHDADEGVAEVSSWQIPMRLGDDRLYVTGTVSWRENVTE